jgi:uncharacterized protein YneF (UPF0154 family)
MTHLKAIPSIATKEMIYEMYKELGKKRVRNAIQLAVDEVNEIKKVKYTKRARILNSDHIKLIVAELGNAPGYEVVEN